ncbi:MAG: magnesium/cobalt transporter CorA [Planctomycetes bacterium]|nr:magnesium/cobalt transporter CorA [Planctomycetota bacterium]
MFRKRHPETGARPGTLVIGQDAMPTVVSVVQYDRDSVRDIDDHEIESTQGLLGDDVVTWIKVQGLGDEETLREIGKQFQIHPLLLEDIVNHPQRPKVETVDGQLLIIARSVIPDGAVPGELEQISLLVGKQFVVTFEERHGATFAPIRQRLNNASGFLRQSGADYLAYALLDIIIDGFYPVLELLGDELERLEDEVIRNPTTEVLDRLNRMRNRLALLRRRVWSQREAMHELLHHDSGLISPETTVFLRDTCDHCLQASEVIEMYRDSASNLMNTYMSSVANRTNEVMKTLTIMSSTFIPLTFVAGIYGMNFEHMPELAWRWSYPAVWVVLCMITVVMLGFFRVKGWIGRVE